MKKEQLTFLAIPFLLVGLLASAQNQKIDSLKEVLAVSTEVNRFDVLWGLAYELYDIDNPGALVFAQQANEYALREGDSLHIVKAGRIMGQLLRRIDKVDQSMLILSSVLPISQRHNFEKELLLILNALAIAHSYKAEYDKALKYHFQSLVIREKVGDKKSLSVPLHNIGFVYYKFHDFNLALEYYFRALKYKKEVNDTFDLSNLLNNIGLCYINLRDYQNAHKYFDEALEFCAPRCNDDVMIQIENSLGQIFFLERDYELATSHYQKSLSLSVKGKNQRFQLENLIELTKIALNMKDFHKAKMFLAQIELIPDKNQHISVLLKVYGINADFYSVTKDYRRANLFRIKYEELKDQIFDSEVSLNFMKVQTQFSERENLARIESQSRIVLLQQGSIRQHQLLNTLVGVVALLTIVLAGVLYRNIRQKRRINTILDLLVKERTFELEKNRDELRHSYDEQAMVLKKVSSDLTSSWATLNGLSNLAARDLPEEQAVYFKEAEATAERMVNCVNKYTATH